MNLVRSVIYIKKGNLRLRPWCIDFAIGQYIKVSV